MRIVLIRPCCIGDVVLATATLTALRRAYPDAHITWAVGNWSQQAIVNHPHLNAVLDTGSAALPVKSVMGFINMVALLRMGRFDMAVSLVRSPLMSAAVMLSGIKTRVGLDSNGRGFGYTVRVPVDAAQPRHEAEIYLDAVRALGHDTSGCYANVPVMDEARIGVTDLLDRSGVDGPYIVMHPGGGNNPGMVMDSKRWPTAYVATLADQLAHAYQARIVLVGGPDDSQLVNDVRAQMQHTPATFIGALTFGQIAALAAGSLAYIGNDTGLTHLAAAAGAKTIMILGPSDPARYAPFTPDSLALWRPAALPDGGVAKMQNTWDWQRDGLQPDEALAQIRQFLG